MDNLHIIVGLGNPGAEYAATRHNAGFIVLDQFAAIRRAEWQFDRKFDTMLTRRIDLAGKSVMFCKPQGYMNNSGESVAPLASYYRVEPSRVMVVVDDADLPLGQLRMRPEGSPGGHHGLESVEQHLGTRAYPRQRIGIGRQGSVRQISGHVLGRFDAEERVVMDRTIHRAIEQLSCWLTEGLGAAMNKFNGVDIDPNKERTAQ